MSNKLSGKDFYTSYRNNILKMVKFLASNTTVTTKCRELSASLGPMLSSLNATRRNSFVIDIAPFEFEVKDKNKASIDLGKSKTLVSIGGNVKVSEELIFQSISVCVLLDPSKDVDGCIDGLCHPRMSSDSTYIIRRFHFDIDTANSNKPTSHFQYGGNIQDNQRGDKVYSLFSALDNPRVPIHPTDIVQVIHIFLSQFNSELKKVILLPEWECIIKENDQIWLKYYHEKIVQLLKSSNPDSFYDISQSLPSFSN